MEAAQKICKAVTAVSLLRQAVDADPSLHSALVQVKRVQSRRFAATHAQVVACETELARALGQAP